MALFPKLYRGQICNLDKDDQPDVIPGWPFLFHYFCCVNFLLEPNSFSIFECICSTSSTCVSVYIYVSIPIPESSKYSKCLSRTVGFFVWKRAYILVQSWKFPTIILPPFLPRKHQFHYAKKARKRQNLRSQQPPVVFCFKQWPNQALATILEDFHLAKRDPFLGGVAEVLRCCDLWPPIFQNIMGGL